MTTATEFAETLQDGIVKAIETSQRITLEALGATMSTIDGILPERPALPFAPALVAPKEAVDTTFRFAEKLLASQKAFMSEIAGLTEPAPVAGPVKKSA